ncbi:NAD(P)/FAD-dependent oxidoreductase [Natrialbaceae archaeon A-CW2]
MTSVTVVGGGIIGVRTALALAKRDLDVRILEKNMLGSGSTAASIAEFHWLQEQPDPFEYELQQTAWKEYKSLVKAGVTEFERIGSMYVAETEETLHQLNEATQKLKEFGLDVEMISPAEAAEYGVSSSDILGAMYTPSDGYLDPHDLIQHWRGLAEDAGVTVETGVEVTDVRLEKESVVGVETTEGSIDSQLVINAAGPWAPELNDFAGVTVPLRHTQGRIMVLQCDSDVSLPNVIFEDGYYFREEGSNQILAGRVIYDYESADMIDPDHAQLIPNDFRVTIADRAEKTLPVTNGASIINEWTGLRTVTPDGLPIVGRSGTDGFLLACGLSGKGIMYAPVVAELVAASVIGEDNDRLAMLARDRFHYS